MLGLVDMEERLTVGMLLRRAKKISKKQGSRECLAMRVIPGELLARQRIGGMVGRERARWWCIIQRGEPHRMKNNSLVRYKEERTFLEHSRFQDS